MAVSDDLFMELSDDQPVGDALVINPNDFHPVVKAFLAGSFSGTFSTILFQPLDLVKTRLQNPAHALHTTADGGVHIQPNMFNVVTSIVRNDHITGLWRGMMPSITRCVPGVGLYFGVLHWLKEGVTERQEGRPLSALQAVGVGVVARATSGALLIPFTVIKTRFESGVYCYNTVGGALRHIYAREGLKGLCCGLAPTLARDAPFSGLYLMFYTQAKEAIPQAWHVSPTATSTLTFSCGVVAGVLASIATNPADVVKTRMQLYPREFPTALSAALAVHQQYGAEGFLHGILPRMLRRTLMAAMAWTLYEKITTNMGLK